MKTTCPECGATATASVRVEGIDLAYACHNAHTWGETDTAYHLKIDLIRRMMHGRIVQAASEVN